MTLYSSREVARQLGVSKTAVIKWAEDRLIPYLELPSGHLRWTTEQVEEIKAGMYRPATAKAAS